MTNKQVIQDEADATERESVRQANIEKARVITAAHEAAKAAAAEEDAEKAKDTFWKRFKAAFGIA